MIYFLLSIVIIIAIILFWSLRKKLYFFISSIILFCAAVLGFYYFQGSGQLVEKTYALQEKNAEVNTLLKQFKNTSAIIEAMKKAIAENQDNPKKAAKGWYLLGRLYEAEGRKSPTKNVSTPLVLSANEQEAIEAFHQAHQLQPNNFTYAFNYLQRLYADNHQEHTPEIDALIAQIKQQQSHHPSVLDFLGYDAYEHGNYPEAIRYWEELLPYLSEDPKTHQAILAAIGKAEKKLLK